MNTPYLPVVIITAVVDVHNLHLYTEQGECITIPQGDPRIRNIVDGCLAADLDNGGKYILTAEVWAGVNHYAEAEKKTNGAVRFFKMVKSAFKKIADHFADPVAPVALGTANKLAEAGPVYELEVVDTGDGLAIKTDQPIDEFLAESFEPVEPEKIPEEDRPLTKGAEAVAAIMAQAQPSSSENFADVVSAETARATGREEEVVVAVLADNTIMHNVEQLDTQLKAVAAGLTSGTGLERFMQRASMVKRGHSAEDLLKFIQKGDLPIADDGCVLAYKLLQPTKEEGVYADCHSGNVKQRVGSYVYMHENLVDANRRKDCSNGLHVARRDYLSSFHGDICVLVKLAPEDVIAVPEYDARKLRAKAYHIIALLSPEDRKAVKSNKPMSDTAMLSAAIAGNHIGVIEHVEITAGYGGGLKVTQVADSAPIPNNATRAADSLDNLDTAVKVDARGIALDLAGVQRDFTAVAVIDQGNVVAVDQFQDSMIGLADKQPEDVAELVKATPVIPAPAPTTILQPGGAAHVPMPKPTPVKTLSPAQKLVVAFEDADLPSTKLESARALLAFKKQAKKSWTALGIPTAVWTKAQEIVEIVDMGAKIALKDCVPVMTPPLAEVVTGKAVAKPAPKKAPAKPKTAPTPKPAAAKPAKAPAKKEGKMTQQEEMAKLVDLYVKNPGKANARAVYAFKQTSKKSWEVLGVTDKKFQAKMKEMAKL